MYNTRPSSLFIGNDVEECFALLHACYAYIPEKTIEMMTKVMVGHEVKHAVAALAFFKHTEPVSKTVYITQYDLVKSQICLVYYCGATGKEAVFLGNDEKEPLFAKNSIETLWGKPCSVHRQLWVEFKSTDQPLRVDINGKHAVLLLGTERYDAVTFHQVRRTFAPESLPLLSRPYKNSWIIMDRPGNADDNGEHFYRYLKNNHPEQQIFFALTKNAADWPRLQAEGFNLLDFGSWKFDIVMRGCKAIISSHFTLFIHIQEYFPRSLHGKRHIWLQHGVTKDDLSQWINNVVPQPDLLVTASLAEHASIVTDGTPYHSSHRNTKLLGLARHDALVPFVGKHQNMVLIMPTWRRALAGAKSVEAVRQSKYAFQWNALLTSEKLRVLARHHSLRLAFFPHANMQPFMDAFTIPEYVERLDHKTAMIQNLFKEATLMITDYSSVAFDMCFMEKPVAYFQFDIDEFFFGSHMVKGYFDYEKHGFGPVAYTLPELLNALEGMLESDEITAFYRERMQKTFARRDGKNCERTYAAVQDLFTHDPSQNIK